MKLASVSFHQVAGDSPQAINYVYDDSTSTPIVSPEKEAGRTVSSNGNTYDSTFKALSVDNCMKTPQVKADFTFADVYSDSHSSASKFIERSLQDLDGLINQRRLELFELRKSHRERESCAKDYLRPLHDSNYKKLASPALESIDKLSSPSVSPIMGCPVTVCSSSPLPREQHY